jgi:mono/diheme cytochrome c family protein
MQIHEEPPMRVLKCLVLLLLLEIVAGIAWLTAGGPDFAADSPHAAPVYALIKFARERSIHVRSEDVKAPPLNDPQKIAEGAHHYGEMCDGCHLAPGKSSDEFRDGLYPRPPDLYKHPIDNPGEAFWIVKHGIKGSAMPAWGKSHDDTTIWAIVAFLQRLPQLTPDQYRQMTTAAEGAAEHGETPPPAGTPPPATPQEPAPPAAPAAAPPAPGTT